jgi:hypothetical protein
MAFERLVRFIDDSGETCYGDVPRGVDIASIVGKKVEALDGSPQAGFKSANRQSVVKQVCLDDCENKLPLIPSYRCFAPLQKCTYSSA